MLLRIAMPLVFIVAVVLLVIGVTYQLKREGQTDKETAANQPQSLSTVEAPPSASPKTATSDTPTPQKTSPSSSVSEALALLESFLKTTTLQERLPMMETKTPGESLAESFLASSFPPFENLVIESQQSFPIENIVDYYFSVDFINKPGFSEPLTVVIRCRGELKPRILADPLLDLYGGRLAAYAAKPQSKGEFFHAVVNPLPACNDLRIPDREKKISLRLLPHENSTRMIQAYASRVSNVGEIISDGNHDLTYGKAKPCVILLGWNTKDDPGAPYLEVLDIKSFHWNP